MIDESLEDMTSEEDEVISGAIKELHKKRTVREAIEEINVEPITDNEAKIIESENEMKKIRKQAGELFQKINKESRAKKTKFKKHPDYQAYLNTRQEADQIEKELKGKDTIQDFFDKGQANTDAEVKAEYNLGNEIKINEEAEAKYASLEQTAQQLKNNYNISWDIDQNAPKGWFSQRRYSKWMKRLTKTPDLQDTKQFDKLTTELNELYQGYLELTHPLTGGRGHETRATEKAKPRDPLDQRMGI